MAHAAGVDGEVEGNSLLAPCGVPNTSLVEVEQMVHLLTGLVGAGGAASHAADGILEGIFGGGGIDVGPL